MGRYSAVELQFENHYSWSIEQFIFQWGLTWTPQEIRARQTLPLGFPLRTPLIKLVKDEKIQGIHFANQFYGSLLLPWKIRLFFWYMERMTMLRFSFPSVEWPGGILAYEWMQGKSNIIKRAMVEFARLW